MTGDSWADAGAAAFIAAWHDHRAAGPTAEQTRHWLLGLLSATLGGASALIPKAGIEAYVAEVIRNCPGPSSDAQVVPVTLRVVQ